MVVIKTKPCVLCTNLQESAQGAPMYLIKNTTVYSPEFVGKKDILLGGTKILAIANDLGTFSSLNSTEHPLQIIDGSKFLAIPGLVDNHLHPTGGGGEGGYTTRTPEMHLSEITTAGVTTVIGTLGTDGTSRTMTNLIAKIKALKEEGISAWCYSGNYHLPIRTLTGNITDDLILIEEVIGAGEIALSDHRSSQPTRDEVARLAAQTRVGGMLSGKAGTINIHMGDGPAMLAMLEDIVATTEIPRTQFSPTHMSRNPDLFKAGIQWAKQGGYVDFTSCTVKQFLDEGELRCSTSLKILLDEGVSLDRITFSSDAGGSLPTFDSKGELSGMVVGTCHSMLHEVRLSVQKQGIDLATALAPVTANPADRLKLKSKGHLATGFDGDLVLLNRDTLEVDTVFAMSKLMVQSGKPVVKGLFEKA